MITDIIHLALMMVWRFFQHCLNALLHLFYPHTCLGCEMHLADPGVWLCFRCRSHLPLTGFEAQPENAVERLFYGRLKLEAAAAHFYFTKRSLVQTLIHELKYRGNRRLGVYLGTFMGHALANAGRFRDIDLLVALPLHRSRQKKRGYNQAAVLIEGIATVMKLPFEEQALERRKATRTQTRKGRVDRWLNMQGMFHVRDPAVLAGKHVLLVDDVITTGATLEACGRALLEVPGLRLSIVSLCQAEN